MNYKLILWLGVGVALGMAFNNTIGSFVNPLLANVKLSVTPGA